jgi:hypothetical protein
MVHVTHTQNKSQLGLNVSRTPTHFLPFVGFCYSLVGRELFIEEGKKKEGKKKRGKKERKKEKKEEKKEESQPCFTLTSINSSFGGCIKSYKNLG